MRMSGTNITACMTERESAEMAEPMPTPAMAMPTERGELQQDRAVALASGHDDGARRAAAPGGR